jgi:CRISPR system Cascade subunit CasA
MSKDFCLLYEPWLPVRLTNGHVKPLGLLDVFRRSGEISALAETSPPSLVAEYRLLLAITHRALTRAFGSWKDKDRARWFREGLPIDEICAYLEHWRERFWLFHPQYPFMQVAVLADAAETREKRKPWTQIALACASGSTPLVFDHACDETPASIFPAEALATLLGYLQFTPGGRVQVVGAIDNDDNSDKAGPLANSAAVLPIGKTLAQTLCLCLHPASTGNSEKDIPAWEQEPLTTAQLSGDPVLAKGINDRYTRQSRAVLLLREEDGGICWIRFAGGFTLDEDAESPDPMVTVKDRIAVKNKPVLRKLTFKEGRAFWRDLHVLVPNYNHSGRAHTAAAVLSYAIGLYQDRFDTVYQPLIVAGLANKQAKLERWRIEQINLPAALLVDADKATYFQELVARSEELYDKLADLADEMLKEFMPKQKEKSTKKLAEQQKERAQDARDKKLGSFAPTYFSFAERTLPDLLRLLGEGENDQAETLWSDTLRKAARFAWEQILTDMGHSSRALRADAKFLPRFHGMLNKYVPEPESTILKEA